MKLRLPLTALFLAGALLACEKKTPAPAPQTSPAPANAQPDEPASAPATTGAVDWKDNVLHRGAPFAGATEAELAQILGKPEEWTGKTLKTSGTISRVCARKGCWMELAAAGQDHGIRITFKDYGFFVPTDSQGAKATVEGTVEVKKLSAEDAAHLEGEGAKITRNAAGEAVELAMVASGVELKREAK
ncbi:MAG: DUF4920 domain-containing protein [Myxococcota bacterium]